MSKPSAAAMRAAERIKGDPYNTVTTSVEKIAAIIDAEMRPLVESFDATLYLASVLNAVPAPVTQQRYRELVASYRSGE